MKVAITVMAAAVLAGCATPGSYNELRDAEREMQLHTQANSYMDIDLQEKGDTTEAQRAPEIVARKPLAAGCHQQFHAAFVSAVDRAISMGGAAASDYMHSMAPQLDAEFANCVKPLGLTGYPEFKVGDRYLRTDAFVRSWESASMRLIQARGRVDGEASSIGMALAFGIGSAGRNAAAYQPAPVIVPTIPQPIQCSSYQYGAYVNTTCR